MLVSNISNILCLRPVSHFHVWPDLIFQRIGYSDGIPLRTLQNRSAEYFLFLRAIRRGPESVLSSGEGHIACLHDMKPH